MVSLRCVATDSWQTNSCCSLTRARSLWYSPPYALRIVFLRFQDLSLASVSCLSITYHNDYAEKGVTELYIILINEWVWIMIVGPYVFRNENCFWMEVDFIVSFHYGNIRICGLFFIFKYNKSFLSF